MRKVRKFEIESLDKIITSNKFLFGIKPFNLMILDSAWKKEMSSFKKYFDLEGIEKNCLIVKAINSSIANEVKIRKEEIIKNMNKYFKTKWIKNIKVITKI